MPRKVSKPKLEALRRGTNPPTAKQESAVPKLCPVCNKRLGRKGRRVLKVNDHKIYLHSGCLTKLKEAVENRV